ncbi:UNVERIFIED_ORG: hypothetical protein GGD58_005492 [Rhizobium pisi]
MANIFTAEIGEVFEHHAGVITRLPLFARHGMGGGEQASGRLLGLYRL